MEKEFPRLEIRALAGGGRSAGRSSLIAPFHFHCLRRN
jgi:hypothetical protein